MDIGDFPISGIVYRKFHMLASGVMTNLVGATAAVYKNASTTQTTTGVSLTTGFDGVTGLHHVEVNLAADATFYAAGTECDIVLTAGTLDGVSVAGLVLFHFAVERAGGTLALVKAIKAKTDTLPASPAAVGSAMTLTTGERTSIATAVTDDVVEIQGGITLQQAQSLILSLLVGRTTGGGLTFRTPNNGAVRIVATVDASNNRTGITLTPSA